MGCGVINSSRRYHPILLSKDCIARLIVGLEKIIGLYLVRMLK